MKNIKIKNYEIESLINILSDQNSLLNSDDKELPIHILWVIDENFKKLNDIMQKIISMKQKVQSKFSDDDHSYPVYDDNGNENGRNIKDEYIDEWRKQISELLNIENEIEISTIPLSSINKLSISGRDYQSIKFMIENDKE